VCAEYACATVNHTMAQSDDRERAGRAVPASVQRSFRLSPRTLELLGERAAETSESRNALAERLLDEGLRIDRHPLIRFRTGGSGLRRPGLVGTRLDIWQVIDTLRDHDGEVAAAAEYLGVSDAMVRAAIDYYADFADEIDAYRAEELAFAERERERSERVRRVLG
jgi:uncharacterized protein (DUF433 family)